MKKILAIGNSFSEDATTYLYSMAKADSIDIKVVNLYIGGCSLETHYQNIQNDSKNYRYDLNGEVTDKYVSIKEALLQDNWDIVTIQQASHYSGVESSYYPYADKLVEYIKKYSKKAEIMVHQTWAYETDSTHGGFNTYGKSQEQMYKDLKNCYDTLAQKIKAETIPCGDAIQKLRKLPEFDYGKTGLSLCRDGFHMSYDYGRYATAGVWYKTIFNNSLADNKFTPPNSECNQSLLEIIKKNI